MKAAAEVSADKLRGGFYTPAPLVRACLDRLDELGLASDARVLEPSAGDGAFVDGLARSAMRSRVGSITAIELLEIEAAKARRRLAAAELAGDVRNDSAVAWAAETDARFDVAVGNPPFVRYQFVSAADRAAALRLGKRLALPLTGVSNLWILVLLGALSRLRDGGVFAFVVPTECLTGVSAAAVRRWLTERCDEIRFDLFAPGSFAGVLQEVAVLSGRTSARADPTVRLRIVDGPRASTHVVSTDGPWTVYLLEPRQVQALEAAVAGLPRVGEVVAFEVSIVTGANDYFTVPAATVEAYNLHGWARPLLPRIRHAPGLVYNNADHGATDDAGARAWLLDFGDDRPDPRNEDGAARYLAEGAARALPNRYKCRIREPWYRVPGIKAGELLLSKRCHRYPRVVVNRAGVFTTDTIYRGRPLATTVRPDAVAANFHNSLTLLTAELEGRSFGGGVLELVPSEIARLRMPLAGDLPLDVLDAIARTGKPDALITATDDELAMRRVIERDTLTALAEARHALMQRRLERNRSSRAAAPPAATGEAA